MDTNTIIGEIYEASMNESRWSAALKSIAENLDSDWATIVFHDRLNRNRNNFFQFGVDPEAHEIYVNELIDLDMETARRELTDTPDELVGDFFFDDFEYVKEIRDSVYNNAARDKILKEYFQSISRLATKLFITPNTIALGSVSRMRRETNVRYAQKDIQFYSYFVPHISRSLRIHHLIFSSRNHGEKLLETFKHFSHGVVLLNVDLQVIYANNEAGLIMGAHPALKVGRGGRLKASNREDDTSLNTLLANALNGSYTSEQNAFPCIALRSLDKSHPLKVTALRLLARDLDIGLQSEGIQLAVFVTDPCRVISLPIAYLQEAYSFTPTEALITQELANGLSIIDISNKRNTSEGTVRAQVKNIQQKTSTHSLAELVRLMVMLGKDFSIST